MHSTRNCNGYSVVGVVVVIAVILCSASVNAEDVHQSTNVQEGRSFGHHFLKRISFALIPAAFVVGVITTLLSALTIVSMKGLGVGVILLVIAVGQIFSRLVPAAAPITYAAPAPAPAPYPVFYGRKTHEIPSLPLPLSADPVWIEGKDW